MYHLVAAAASAVGKLYPAKQDTAAERLTGSAGKASVLLSLRNRRLNFYCDRHLKTLIVSAPL